jgi:hypothetical protein
MGIFDRGSQTGPLVQELTQRGFRRNDILIFGGNDRTEEHDEEAEPEELTTLFRNRGVPDVDAGHFAECVRQGDVVVSVQTTTEQGSEEAAGVLDRYGAIDVEQRVPVRQGAADAEQEAEASRASAEALERSLNPGHQSGRTRGSRVFVW